MATTLINLLSTKANRDAKTEAAIAATIKREQAARRAPLAAILRRAGVRA